VGWGAREGLAVGDPPPPPPAAPPPAGWPGGGEWRWVRAVLNEVGERPAPPTGAKAGGARWRAPKSFLVNRVVRDGIAPVSMAASPPPVIWKAVLELPKESRRPGGISPRNRTGRHPTPSPLSPIVRPVMVAVCGETVDCGVWSGPCWPGGVWGCQGSGGGHARGVRARGGAGGGRAAPGGAWPWDADRWAGKVRGGGRG